MSRKPSVSYRRLLNQSKSAAVASIELFNKPTMEYKVEAFVVLLVNAWELLCKAILAKNGRTIFYSKERDKPYRSFHAVESFRKARDLINSELSPQVMLENIKHIVELRDNVIHFYNETDLLALAYALGQTALVSYNDVLRDFAGHSLDEELSIYMLPIGGRPFVDPITYLSSRATEGSTSNSPIYEFLHSIQDTLKDFESKGLSPSRFITVYDVSLNSIRTVTQADFILGVRTGDDDDPVFVERHSDPNITHPFGEKDLLQEKISDGSQIGQYKLRAFIWDRKIKEKKQYCWCNKRSNAFQYSGDVKHLIHQITLQELEGAIARYKTRYKT